MVLVGGSGTCRCHVCPRSCWETSALLCTCCLGLGLTQPSKACGRRPGHVAGQPWVPGVSVQKRVTLTSDSIL